jgi:hypothetical protein
MKLNAQGSRDMTKMTKTLLAVAAAVFAGTLNAATCGTSQRTATLDSADSCTTAGEETGTPQAADVLAKYPGSAWSKRGELSGSNGTNDLFTVTASSWGNNVTGTWAINPSFWTSYGEAVITMHVGNGAGDPDWWFFDITQGATAGTFSYDKLNGGGGGLSNLFLWSRGTPPPPPEVPLPGTLGLLGLGLVGLGAVRRRKS